MRRADIGAQIDGGGIILILEKLRHQRIGVMRRPPRKHQAEGALVVGGKKVEREVGLHLRLIAFDADRHRQVAIILVGAEIVMRAIIGCPILKAMTPRPRRCPLVARHTVQMPFANITCAITRTLEDVAQRRQLDGQRQVIGNHAIRRRV
jgi:hypothetical protein